MKKYNTVLFDLDGTLLDTNELIISSFLHTLEQFHPGEYAREDVFQFMGPSLKETFGSINPERAEEMISTYVTHNRAKHDELVEVFDGVYETVKKLHENGFKLAIVTTKMRKTVNMGLELSKLTPFFPVVVTFEDVSNTKPHPEPLQLALNKLGATADEAIMVGDNHHDIDGGKNAGVDTVGVAWSVKGKEHLATYSPDFIIDSMDELLSIVGVK